MNLGELYLRYTHKIINYKFETLAVSTQVKPCHLLNISAFPNKAHLGICDVVWKVWIGVMW